MADAISKILLKIEVDSVKAKENIDKLNAKIAELEDKKNKLDTTNLKVRESNLKLAEEYDAEIKKLTIIMEDYQERSRKNLLKNTKKLYDESKALAQKDLNDKITVTQNYYKEARALIEKNKDIDEGDKRIILYTLDVEEEEAVATMKKNAIELERIKLDSAEKLKTLDTDEEGLVKNSTKNAKITYEAKRKALTDELKLYEGNAEKQNEIGQKILDLDKKRNEERIKNAQDTAKEIMSVFKQMNSLFDTRDKRELAKIDEKRTALNIELADYQQQLKEKEKSDTDYEIFKTENEKEQSKIQSEKYKLDKIYAEKEKAALKRKALRDRAYGVFEIATNTAIAIAKALTFSPVPLNFIMAAAVGAAGALQMSALLAAKIPTKAARGGLIGGNSHAMGGTLIEAEAGEMIINKRSAAMFGPVLSAINQAGGGVPFNGVGTDGGFAVREYRRQQGGEQLPLSAITESVRQGMQQAHVVVAVEDINLGQNNYSEVRDKNTL